MHAYIRARFQWGKSQNPDKSLELFLGLESLRLLVVNEDYSVSPKQSLKALKHIPAWILLIIHFDS